MTARLADHDARDRIRSDHGTTLVVEAAAGTGKTTALVGRIVDVVRTGTAQLDRIIAVTFTEAAAGELKLRLRTEIERARHAVGVAAERERLMRALEHLEAARIGTIHGFCADLLRERPVEARVDPGFQVASEDVAAGLFDRVFDRWFERELAAPSEGVRRVLRRRTRFEDGPRALLRTAAKTLADWRDFPAPWRRETFDRDGEIDVILCEMASLGSAAAGLDPDDYFTRSLAQIGAFAQEIDRRERVAPRDHDGLEAEIAGQIGSRHRHWNWKGFTRGKKNAEKELLRERRQRLHEHIARFTECSGTDIAPALRDVLWSVVEAYDAAKARAGYLDFLDLLLRARDLVRDHDEVRRELQVRFTHVFVDEFQDIDPLQAELLLLIAADDAAARDWSVVRPVPGKLFIVGDPKQSIYRFRRADVALYERVKRQLLDAGAVLLHLTVSFRAVPDIQAVVNAAFAQRMGEGSASQAAYVPLDPHRPAVATQPAVVALPVPRPYGDYGTIVSWKIETSLPIVTAAFIEWLVTHSGWTVEEGGARVPLRPRHVCVLFRRLRQWGTDVTRDYVRALEARYVPHVLVGGSSFHVREEVEALRNALAAIERPDDDLMVFATLRGPLFALSDAQLLGWRTRFGSLHPFRTVPDDLDAALVEVADALAMLRGLHRRRNHRPIAETIATLLAGVRAHAALAIWPAGEQALANVGRVMDLARRAERQGVTSFRAFVDRLFEDARSGEAGDAPIVEDGTEGVRIMTVHKAKGLEFPVVILADLTCNETAREATRHVDVARGLCVQRICGASPAELLEQAAEEHERDREEAARVLYVASTRARDLLVVPVLADQRQEQGWLGGLDPAIYPPVDRMLVPLSRQAEGCPPFGPVAVERPERAKTPPWWVVPGVHAPAAGAHTVVWWDPFALALEVQESVGLRQQTLLAADESGVRSRAGVEAHDAWQARRVRERATAAEPRHRVMRPTDEQAGPVDAEIAVTIERIAIRAGRPRGRRFGALVDVVLATIDLNASADTVARVTATHGRALGAPAAEVEAAVEAVTTALAHPVMRAAERTATLRRQCPVQLTLDDGTLIDGVLDAAFEDDAGWVVVDFKTDVDLDAHALEYGAQVRRYAMAIRRATGRPVRAVLLRV